MSKAKSKAELRSDIDEMLISLTEKIISPTEYDKKSCRRLSKKLAKRNPFKDGTVIDPLDSSIALKYLNEFDDGQIHFMLSLAVKWWRCRIKGVDWTELAKFDHKVFSIAIWGAYLQWCYLSEGDLYE